MFAFEGTVLYATNGGSLTACPRAPRVRACVCPLAVCVCDKGKWRLQTSPPRPSERLAPSSTGTSAARNILNNALSIDAGKGMLPWMSRGVHNDPQPRGRFDIWGGSDQWVTEGM